MKPCIKLLTLAFISNIAFAQEASTDNTIGYKLTYSHFNTKAFNANDVNLRVNKDNQTIWLAAYKENPSNFNQLRSGYERTDYLTYVKIISSIQLATHGFLGGALTAEIGRPFYAIIGYGRTNLKPYDNINFDPNDSITLGAGWHVDQDLNISMYGVEDNRVIDGQRITHLMVNKRLPEDQKITLDIFQKSGPPDNQGQSIHGLGCALTYDISQYFLRLAYDPKVNFTQENMSRVSIGVHF